MFLRSFLVLLALTTVISCDKKPVSAAQSFVNVFAPASIESFGLAGTKNIALTFDDGPGAGTAEILKVLKKYNIRATFFTLGEQALLYPGLMRQIEADGHIVANHSYNHKNLASGKLSSAYVISDLLKVHEAIAPYQNPTHGKYFRAPFGAWKADHVAALNANPVLKDYIGPIYWDIGGQMGKDCSADWVCWKKRVSVEGCLRGYVNETFRHQGGVVLFHDVNAKSAAMVSEYIPELIAEGYRFVTLDEIESLRKYR